MRRRDLLLTALVLTLLPKPVAAQEPDRTWRIGVLTPTVVAASTIHQFTLPELARLGFVEGQNLTLRTFSADGDYERFPALADDLVEWKPDVIIANASTTAIRAARAATATIPIVMSFAGEDPVEAGWAESYARPSGNVTGIVMLSPELDGKRLQIFHEAFPSARRLAVLYLPRAANSPNARAMETAAAKIGIEIVPFLAATPDEYEAAFEAMRSAKVDGLAISSNPIFIGDIALLAELAMSVGLPTICEWRVTAEKGCLISYGPSNAELRRRTADFVARILRGTPAGELPLEKPTVFEMLVNLNTA